MEDKSMIAKGYDGECDYNRREFLYGDGTVLYPDCCDRCLYIW